MSRDDQQQWISDEFDSAAPLPRLHDFKMDDEAWFQLEPIEIDGEKRGIFKPTTIQ